MESLKTLEGIVETPTSNRISLGGTFSKLLRPLLVFPIALSIALGAYAGTTPIKTPQQTTCEFENTIKKEFNKHLKGVTVGVGVLPTLVSVPSEDGIIYALGNTREIEASGTFDIIGNDDIAMTLSSTLSGFYSSNKIFSSSEELGSAESAGGFFNASLGGVVKVKYNWILFGKAGMGISVLNVLKSEYAGVNGERQTENGLNWTGNIGLEYVSPNTSTITLSVGGKGGFYINDKSLDLRGLQQYGADMVYTNPDGIELFARISGENVAGDQTPFSNTFIEGRTTIPFKNIANLFGNDNPDYLNNVSLTLGYAGALSSEGLVRKYAEGDKTSRISVGISYKFKGGTITPTSEVSLNNPVTTDTGMPPAGINFIYTNQGDQ